MEASCCLTSKPILLSSNKRKLIHGNSSVTCCSLDAQAHDDGTPPAINTDWRSFRARLVLSEQVLPTTLRMPNARDPIIPPIQTGKKWAHPLHEFEKGCLLIATEKLDGVHIFERTVVLVLSVCPEAGVTGVILNRPSLMSIKETRSIDLDVAGTFSDRPLFFGGPLKAGVLLVGPRAEEDAVSRTPVFKEVIKGLHYGTKESVGCAAEMVKNRMLGLREFRFFDGYCGWESEELRDEIGAGFWRVAACSPSVLGLAGVVKGGLWEEVMGLVGEKKVW